MIIDQQPTKMAFSRTPIYYLVSDANYAESKFEYIADVWIWQGTYADKPVDAARELRQPPGYQYGNTLFDVRTITTDYFLSQPEVFDLDSQADGLYVWVEIGFGYIYQDGLGEYVIQRNLATSQPILVTNGYNQPSEGINYLPEQYLGEQPGSRFMTDRPLVGDIPYTDVKGEECSAYMFIKKQTTLPYVDRVNLVLNGGEEIHSIFLDDNGHMLQPIGVGLKQMGALFGAAIEPGDSYTVYGTDGTNYPVTEVYTFNVVSACQYGFWNMQFMNRFGVWDNLFFLGNRELGVAVTRQQVLFSPLVVGNGVLEWDKFNGQYRMANIHGRDSLTINTGWIGEAWDSLLRQFMLTSRVYSPERGYALILTSSNLRFKTQRKDKVINYAFTFEYGYTAVNTI